ncbi:MAG TPA: DinB family protein [Cyclobacteriaceae bacterium]|jgi:uncharacterized damage-inducible protein DinB|nr:MAG: DinB family protein [Bacteroidota bacterium]
MKWFERKFDFSFGMEQFEPLMARLRNGPAAFASVVETIPADVLETKPDGKWSIKEHIGHIFVLEPLWQIRFDDIRNNKPVMTPADLNNRATDEGGFNAVHIDELLERLRQERSRTIALLSSLGGNDFNGVSLHPRLQKEMRVIDLMYFVAEHDDHHLNAIQNISATERN